MILIYLVKYNNLLRLIAINPSITNNYAYINDWKYQTFSSKDTSC